VTLTAQQPLNNVVRVAIQTLAATLGGTQSLHTNSYDEALSLPTAASATLALRTQQIVAHESGITNTVDPLAGSYYVESLTDELERRARALIEHVESLGGAAQAIAAGYFQNEIAKSAYAHQLRVEQGEAVIVGVNRFVEENEPPIAPGPDYSRLEAEQQARVRTVRQQRNAQRTGGAISALVTAARDSAGGRIMPHILEAVRARATVGEISNALESVWGRYRPS
jgi:methylmalonyl-CoA mutase N-terminal domain/subunit